MNHLLFSVFLFGCLGACGEPPSPEEAPTTVTVHEQGLKWGRCLVGQTSTFEGCVGVPRRLALCNDESCATSPAETACKGLGSSGRLPTFSEYQTLREVWPGYEDQFDFPQVLALILTSTIPTDYPTWVAAYRVDPNDPERDPQILFEHPEGAWVHCVSPANEGS